MTYVRPRPTGLVLLVYVIAGAAIGLAVPALKATAANAFGRSGLGVAYVVNVAMPLLVVVLAAAYPRLWVALLGTLLATAAFLGTTGILAPGRGWPLIVARRIQPVLLLACIAYHVLAVITVLAVNPQRRVGRPVDPLRCAKCGYPLTGLTEPRCPECFTAFDPRLVAGAAPQSPVPHAGAGPR